MNAQTLRFIDINCTVYWAIGIESFGDRIKLYSRVCNVRVVLEHGEKLGN